MLQGVSQQLAPVAFMCPVLQRGSIFGELAHQLRQLPALA